jgi:phage terminase large subunit
MPPAATATEQQEAPAFKFYQTTATERIFDLDKRIRAVAGGTSASKTVSIMVWLIAYSQTHRNKLVDVVSESYPHLEAGSMLDFRNIMIAHHYWKRERWNETKHTYTFETGTVLRFRSLELSSAHGPRRDVLFINEANNIPLGVFDQLEPRTREIIWLDWNPSTEFWFYTDVLEQRKDDVDFITLTYKDNEALDAATIKSIESRRHKKQWWQVYGLGQLGEVEGRIYTGWQVIEEIPHEARLMRYGLDFGYSKDPAAIVAVYYYNGGYILDEIVYSHWLHNSDLAEILLNQDQMATVVADNASPQSIDDIYRHGVPIVPCMKGKDSIRRGIDYVQDQRISVTSRSVNLLKEYRTYLWETDKDGNQTQVPQDFDNHLMDALRYALESLRAPVRHHQTPVRQINLAMPT